MRSTILMLVVVAIAPMSVIGADAVLWDLIIDANVSDDVVYGDDITIYGVVTDHAGHPESGMAQIRIGSDNVKERVGLDGRFEATIKQNDLLPGTHVVQINVVTEDGRHGMSSAHVLVRGDFRQSDHIARMLANEQAMRYLGANATDFDNDPIGAKLYAHYQELQSQLIVWRGIESSQEQSRRDLIQSQLDADLLLQKVLKDHEGNDFAHNAHSRKMFIDSLDDSVQDIFIAQFNHTLDVYRTAKAKMQSALEGGMSMQEAMNIYKSNVEMPRQSLEGFMENMEDAAKNRLQTEATSAKPVHVESAMRNATSLEQTQNPETADAFDARVEPETDLDDGVTTVYLNIDGVMTRHTFNGTHLVLAE